MVLLSLWHCRQLPWCCRLPERSLPGPRCSGVTGLGNTPCGACWFALLTDGGWRRVGTQQLVRPPGFSVWSPPGAERVVCARWCPTLPHPGGCSTIGAVRLSFRVRDGSGRFPVAVTTETTTWAVRQCSCDSVIRLPANTHTRMRMLCVWLVVGLGVDRIVDALRMLTRAHPPPTHAVCVVCGGVVVCVGLLVPVSSKPLPVFHFWPINPVVCWGPTKKDKSFLRRPYLEDGFPLRCFQRLPFPNVANQPCPGRDNWHTRGSSVPVLSY